MAAKSDKVIITCAITGAIHTPTMSDALPITPDQIAEQAIAAAEAGAAILHLHARNPQVAQTDIMRPGGLGEDKICKKIMCRVVKPTRLSPDCRLSGTNTPSIFKEPLPQ